MSSVNDRELDGFLSKMPARATRLANWQRRWFVLKGDTLAFFNTPEDATAGTAPKWTLDLAQYGATATPLGAGEPTRFDLQAGAESFRLKADSEVEAEMWVAALKTEGRGDPHLRLDLRVGLQACLLYTYPRPRD